MSKTLATFMTVGFATLVLTLLIKEKCFEDLKLKNAEYHNTVIKYQINTK